MTGTRVGIITQSALFASGIRRILSAAGEFEVVRIHGGVPSIRQYLPLHAIVIDSTAMERLNLRKLLFVPELPEIRVLCVDLDANRAVVVDRGLAEFSRAGDVVALLRSTTGTRPGGTERKEVLEP